MILDLALNFAFLCFGLGMVLNLYRIFTAPGVPDRILIFPFGLVAFLELKAPGKRPTPLQVAIREKMERNNAHVSWADSAGMVDSLLKLWGDLDRQAETGIASPAEDIF